MARYELTKTIEARKLNQRSGLPLGEPPVSVPYSAILDKINESWDFVKFTYLGANYQCPTPVFHEATRPYGSPDPEPQPGPSSPVEEPAPPGQPPKQVKMRWETLSSNHSSVLRAKVPGGWLVTVGSGGVTFYPDPEHVWDGSAPG